MSKHIGQEFYELMQAYRFANVGNQAQVIEAFEEVKKFATEAAQAEIAIKQLRIEQLEEALKWSGDVYEREDVKKWLLCIRGSEIFDSYFYQINRTARDLLSTPTTSEHLKEWMMGRLDVVKDAFGNNVFPFDVYRIKESDK
jgi:hypothetical protein